MKSQNKKLTAILIYFFSLLNSYAQNDVNKLFFNLPLESSRDTIYDAIKQYGFIKKGTKGILTQNDVTIKTFYGYLDPKIAKDVLPSADSIKIQLSISSSFTEIDKYYQNSLILWSYYHFSNGIDARKFLKEKKIELEKITPKKLLHYSNSNHDVETGFGDKLDDNENNRKISIELKKQGLEYVVTLEYERNEGEKKLLGQFVPKKELVYREISKQDLFQFNNVEQIPITNECSIKNEKSLDCFKISISRQIMVDDSYLAPGSYKFWLKFIATKNNEIINITVTHPNKKLCEDVANSINKLKIIEPAINNGKKVDFLASFPVTITID